MDKKIILWIVLGLIVLLVVVQTFYISIVGKTVAGNAGGTGKIDTAGWTENEKMNYEMHGVIPARVKGSAGPSSGGMVGGC